ncbi:tetranectin-like [Erpetoichthys calabaricus]|nr:tetranectin-like [Erpetoichthys calabaricus]
MERRGACLLVCLLCVVPTATSQNATEKKDAANAEAIEELKKQMDDIWKELNLMKEQQALQTVCLKGLKIHSKCFLAGNHRKNYHAASEDCIAQGGTLSTPIKEEENNALLNYMFTTMGTEAQIWLGINDMANEGTWIDMTGTNIKYKNWETEITAQPDGDRAQNCVVLTGTSNGKWFDENCRAEKRFICEFNIV